MKRTFDDMVEPGGSIEKIRIFEYLKTAYGFEPMPEEMGLFVTTLHLDEESGALCWEEIEVGLDQIREMLTGVAKNATEHCSYGELKDDRFKHRRYGKDPMDKFKS